MGKRRDWEIWQDGMCVAKSSGAADAFHYAMIYSQDGPVELKPPSGVSLDELRRMMDVDDLNSPRA